VLGRIREKIEQNNRSLIKFFATRLPEYWSVFAGLAAEAIERGSSNGWRTFLETSAISSYYGAIKIAINAAHLAILKVYLFDYQQIGISLLRSSARKSVGVPTLNCFAIARHATPCARNERAWRQAP
jgi:hypothetical protein